MATKSSYLLVLTQRLRDNVLILQHTQDGPLRVYAPTANGERYELAPDMANTLLALFVFLGVTEEAEREAA